MTTLRTDIRIYHKTFSPLSDLAQQINAYRTTDTWWCGVQETEAKLLLFINIAHTNENTW